MAFVTPDGNIEYFRRIPGDLYKILDGNPKTVGVEPWILDMRTNQQAKTQLFEKDGRLYVYETITLDESGTYPFSETDLLKNNAALLPNEIKEQIGVRAYQLWVKAGRPQGTSGANFWTQAEAGFQTQTGPGAYQTWAATRSTTGDDVVWAQALGVFRSDIDKKALADWNANPNKKGTGPTVAETRAVEATFGDKIAMEAYGRWNQDGRKPGTTGVGNWTAGEPAFQDKLSLPAFNAWVDGKKPTQGDNAVWAGAITEWDKAGKPIMQQVEIRAPFRIEGNSDVPKPHTTKTSDYGRRDRFNWGVGPIEGWRMHANLELLGNYRYNIPTTTTFRIGGPSPTQGWSWDVRQQDTTMWSRFNLSVGTIEYNGAQVYDLTDDSRNGWTVMNSRLYTDIGNRNRIRFDGTGRYLRFRETGFLEIGLGADFFKRTTADGTFNINGYYELQLYAPDFRSQVNMTGSGRNLGFNNTRGFEAFPLLGIDPAFQISWSSNKGIRLADIPGLSSDNS